MRQIHYVIQTLLRGKGSIPFKVISLGLGLAMSILLFARVAYEQSYDTCFRDYDRIYQVWSQFIMNGETLEPQNMNMGPLAGAIFENFPKEVEMATCTNRYLASWPLYYGNHRFNESKICADSLFFQTMGIEVLSGNPVQDLQQPNVIYLSKSLAERMFGGEEPIGKVISYNHERDLTVRGTFADLPDNTTVGADAVISLPPAWAAKQMNYSWDGGDSYCQYVRLRPEVDVDDLNARMKKMAEKYLPARDSWSYTAYVQPLRDTFRQQDDVRRMFTIMLTLGLSILFITALNYALISISSLSRRAKMVGVHKCSGASGEGIFGMFMLETLMVVALALGVMFLLLWGFRDFVEDTAATKLTNLFEGSRLWVPAATVGVLLLVGGVLPGRLFARIPVTQVFRRYTDGKRSWKRGLLTVQFIGVAFIGGMLLTTVWQYHDLMTRSVGFRAEGLAVGTVTGNIERAQGVADAIRREPYVEAVAGSGTSLLAHYSTNRLTDNQGNFICPLHFTLMDKEMPQVTGMTLLEGHWPQHRGEAVVGRTTVETLKWGDTAIGRKLPVDPSWARLEEQPVVTGVVEDVRNMGFFQGQTCTAFILNDRVRTFNVRLKAPLDDNLKRLNAFIKSAYPDLSLEFTTYQDIRREQNASVSTFRNTVWVTTACIILIVLMGLIGYVSDETQRRSKEIAVRKVNGAEASDILRLLSLDILKIAVLAVAAGMAAAWYVSGQWMQQFADSRLLSPAWYALLALLLLVLIVAVVVLKAWRIANENPVLSIKSE